MTRLCEDVPIAAFADIVRESLDKAVMDFCRIAGEAPSRYAPRSSRISATWWRSGWLKGDTHLAARWGTGARHPHGVEEGA